MPITKPEYRCIFTVHSTPEYAPIRIMCRLNEEQALILMATPVKSVGIAVQRAGGMVLDATPEALEFNDGGNKAKGV